MAKPNIVHDDLLRLRAQLAIESTTRPTTKLPNGRVEISLSQTCFDLLEKVRLPWEDHDTCIDRVLADVSKGGTKFHVKTQSEFGPVPTSRFEEFINDEFVNRRKGQHVTHHGSTYEMLKQGGAAADAAIYEHDSVTRMMAHREGHTPVSHLLDNITEANHGETRHQVFQDFTAKKSPKIPQELERFYRLENDPEVTRLLQANKMIQKHHFLGLLWQFANPRDPSTFPMEGMDQEKWEAVSVARAFHLAVYDLATDGEMFFFGTMDDSTVQTDGVEAFKEMTTADFRFPHVVNIFYSMIQADQLPYNGHMFQVIIDLRGDTSGFDQRLSKYFGGYVVLEYCLLPKEQDESAAFAPVRGIVVHTETTGSLKYLLLYHNYDVSSEEDHDHRYLPVVLGATALMNLMIYTEGMPRAKVTIDPKLSKARARNRKPTLYGYTYINGRKYKETREENRRKEAIGHHASPGEHKRIGHPRTYKKSGKTIWIKPTVVMEGVPAAKERLAYKVKRPKRAD